MSDRRQRQIELAERLQDLLLRDFESQLSSGEMSPTDRATLARLLMQNGWTLDPSKLPQGLQGMLTTQVDPEELDDDDVFDLRERMRA